MQTANDHKSNSFVDCIRSAHKLHDFAIPGLHRAPRRACSWHSLPGQRIPVPWQLSRCGFSERGKGIPVHGSSANNSHFSDAKTTWPELLPGIFSALFGWQNVYCIVINLLECSFSGKNFKEGDSV